jgi:hypothetical protein
LNIKRQTIGKESNKNEKDRLIPSNTQKMKKTRRVSPKLIAEDTLFENRNRYFGTLILVNIGAFSSNDPIVAPLESEKKENTIFPQKR